ncbi:serine/threonine protein kinase [Actinobacteria bacterium YIM 96077]|uniref:non-specific serine/threonine protein kinase n=1 Tax=Phytoactinopolyspora halophila TaxID=1981511 RepID=A0A329QI57_9ACTN|nr:serine/threonine-protein kinase [Phytoactinopolyspora halophila]AYY14678.1 serine/threonine protein kinase [Actinobacteria bacterium YIM 96077]RAW11611.1 hypothetical protein DPM12_16190 [Phytoactinopolyspora halophila]
MAVLADRYELGETLGTGGMAQVVAAYDHMLGRRVAVKLIHDTLASDPTSRERLLREARTAAGMHHPNTVTVFDAGESEGKPFIVMELVQGRSLADRLQAEQRIPRDETITIADAVLAGLHAAHQHGLVHRDVKPSNILLPETGEAKLVDFGVAKALAETTTGLTGTGQLLGTPRYLAPEQALGQPATPASDIYSLGVVIYQCLAGDAPFTADTPLAEALAHQNDPVPSLTTAAPETPAWLATVVERALAKDPADRFDDAEAMRRALDNPVATAPPPPPPSEPAERNESTRVLSISAAASPAAHPNQQASSQQISSRVRPRAQRIWLAVASAAGIAALVTGIFLLGDDGSGGEPGASAQDAAADGSGPEPGQGGEDDTEPVTDAASEEPDGDGGDETGSPQPDDSPAVPATLDELMTMLASNPQAHGDKAEDLVNQVEKLYEQRDGRKRAEQAQKLVEKVATWMADDELDARTGQTVVAVLTEVSRPSDPALDEALDLYGEIAVTTRDWGDDADDLLSDLREILKAKNSEKQADEAEDLVEEIEEWIEDGEIDRRRGERALSVLRPLED